MKKLVQMPSIVRCQGVVCVESSDLDLDLTLLGGQSFRWTRTSSECPTWRGVAYDSYWQLKQNANNITYEVHAPKSRRLNSKNAHALLSRYLRLDFDLGKHVDVWKSAHKHFASLSSDLKAVRVLAQEPLENILAFICSQNNHIKRISAMINWLCARYGTHLGTFDGVDEYGFPTLEALVAVGQEQLEANLREAKFGYRAKFIAQTVAHIQRCGGTEWFERLQRMPYEEARLELTSLPGIGQKVADCICLMSLGHLQAVPIDTHIYKIAQASYMPGQLAKVKSVTPKIYEEIASHFRTVYGDYAGWAQAVLFCSGLQQFKDKTNQDQRKLKECKSTPTAAADAPAAAKKKRKKT